MPHDCDLAKTSQKYKNFRDHAFPLHHSEKTRIQARSPAHQSRENSSKTAARTFGGFLLSMVCSRVLLLVFQTKKPLSGLQINILRARSLRDGRRFKLSGNPQVLEFLEIHFGLIFFGRTFPPSVPAFLFRCAAQKELHSSRGVDFAIFKFWILIKRNKFT